MTNIEKHLLTAISVSATLVILNIFAVSQSNGENYYRVIEQFVTRILPLPF